MPINLAEALLTLTQAAGICPNRRRGRPTHTSTLYRWADQGLHGVILETIQAGGVRCTTREALFRFFQRLSEKKAAPATQASAEPCQAEHPFGESAPHQPPPTSESRPSNAGRRRTPAQRRRAAERAVEQLQRRGV